MLECANVNENPSNKIVKALSTNCDLDNCKFNSKTLKQPVSYNPSFDVHSTKEWIVKRNFLALFQHAGNQMIIKNRMEKCLCLLKNLNSCSLANVECIDVENNVDKKPLNNSMSCYFPILSKIKREPPFVYKRLEYNSNKLMDITSCYGDYLRKDVIEDEAISCELEEYKHNFHVCITNDTNLEMMGSSKSRNNHLLKAETVLGVNPFPKSVDEHSLFSGSLKDTVDCFSQWNQLPSVFFNLHLQKCFLPMPRRANYADAFLSNLPPPSLDQNFL